MGINLVTFAAQTVTPQDDALIYETALQESGMIYGGAVTIKSANILHVAAGHGALCGRKFTIEETDVAVGLTPSGSLLGRIYIHMDLSDTGEPISFQTETANSLTPVIQQSDVNINNGVYEINLATFTVDTSTISNLVNVAPFIDISPDSEFSASSNNPLMNKAITKAIGDPETIGGSASQPYTKGALLLATDGQIYEVTQNIALHGSIVNGGNVSPTGNIISQISNFAKTDSARITTITNGTGNVWFYRFGKIGIMSLDITPSNANACQFTPPDGFKMNMTLYDYSSYNNQNVYVYGYYNTAIVVAHTTLDIIHATIPYLIV